MSKAEKEAAEKEVALAIFDFERICAEGRISPVPFSALVRNRVQYMAACEALYKAMYLDIADTGVQIMRNADRITTIVDDSPKD